MTHPAEKVVVISTGHLDWETVNQLEGLAETKELDGFSRREGFMFTTLYEQDSFSHLSFILGYFKALGFDWVMFDKDGPMIEGLNFFDW